MSRQERFSDLEDQIAKLESEGRVLTHELDKKDAEIERISRELKDTRAALRDHTALRPSGDGYWAIDGDSPELGTETFSTLGIHYRVVRLAHEGAQE